MLIVTNNCKVRAYYEAAYPILYVEGGYGVVLRIVRDKIHAGHRLITHPLSGSIKPSETPYESIVISKEAAALDVGSLRIIEASIAAYEKFMKNTRQRNHDEYSESALSDFREIDFTLLQSALK